MPLETARMIGTSGASGALFAVVASDGTAGHRYPGTLRQPAAPTRDVTDMLHVVAMLHGRHPGIIGYAAQHTDEPGANAWLAEASTGFAEERRTLAILVAASGPLPSTPGQAESEAAVIAQHHAFDMLSQSDRRGCALGTAAALVLDWHAVRILLDRAATRMGIDIATAALPSPVDSAVMIDGFATTSAVERALLFGAQQFAAQQRGLWSLLEARSIARNHS
ncbi:DUF6975 family protein [Sphingomonas qomolangmaensis]|uniref:Uncharacterized protein n=1 Tax=Sphingomonas qomolangmaensis TaxID=2918765 RepID=A0ABY5L8L0_9SPHN|nr:hypothetical protein [Sphingomonas qomolangmaensis]UUL83319.1 hypothetical protein NMP03_03550 [Sphingomonas qomolangmaensis]